MLPSTLTAPELPNASYLPPPRKSWRWIWTEEERNALLRQFIDDKYPEEFKQLRGLSADQQKASLDMVTFQVQLNTFDPNHPKPPTGIVAYDEDYASLVSTFRAITNPARFKPTPTSKEWKKYWAAKQAYDALQREQQLAERQVALKLVSELDKKYSKLLLLEEEGSPIQYFWTSEAQKRYEKQLRDQINHAKGEDLRTLQVQLAELDFRFPFNVFLQKVLDGATSSYDITGSFILSENDEMLFHTAMQMKEYLDGKKQTKLNAIAQRWFASYVPNTPLFQITEAQVRNALQQENVRRSPPPTIRSSEQVRKKREALEKEIQELDRQEREREERELREKIQKEAEQREKNKSQAKQKAAKRRATALIPKGRPTKRQRITGPRNSLVNEFWEPKEEQIRANIAAYNLADFRSGTKERPSFDFNSIYELNEEDEEDVYTEIFFYFDKTTNRKELFDLVTDKSKTNLQIAKHFANQMTQELDRESRKKKKEELEPILFRLISNHRYSLSGILGWIPYVLNTIQKDWEKMLEEIQESDMTFEQIQRKLWDFNDRVLGILNMTWAMYAPFGYGFWELHDEIALHLSGMIQEEIDQHKEDQSTEERQVEALIDGTNEPGIIVRTLLPAVKNAWNEISLFCPLDGDETTPRFAGLEQSDTKERVTLSYPVKDYRVPLTEAFITQPLATI